MFVFHILVYVIFALLMSNFAKQSTFLYPNSNKLDKYIWLFILFYTFICAIRWNVGIDSAGYAYGFAHGSNVTSEKINSELLFYGIEHLFNKLQLHFTFGLGLCAFVQIFSITKALQDYKYILITLPIVLFGSRYFLDLNNGVRQMIAASMFVYASRYIYDKKIFHYLAFVLIASLIHHSSIILFVFYFLPNKIVISDKRWLMLGIFSVCFIAGQTPAFQGLIHYTEMLTSSLGYDDYSNRVVSLLSEGTTKEALTFGPMMLSYFMTALFTIWFGPNLKKKYEKEMPYFNLWYNFSFFFACSYFLVCNVSHIFIRPVLYFELFQLITVSLLLFDFGFSRTRHQILSLILTLTLWVNISWDIVKVSGRDWESTTYKVYFLHQDQVKRFFDSWNYLKK